ncbi:hypothetical protein SAMN05216601_106152 [Ectopseudomonas composti]|uniref:Uncharacterized protein n=1 Tax=Ectopseudomonas composti TaxID=658457 RepID=A0A1I5N7T9_9GAMM|nr:hypothetical protein [Pseudomonas composti]SFP17803.1 hypothetical protein SAMN05216601_106152 [Pseudomonas composti]
MSTPIIKFMDLALGDRFRIEGDEKHLLLTKIDNQRARTHCMLGIQNELYGQESDPIVHVEADWAVKFVPVAVDLS